MGRKKNKGNTVNENVEETLDGGGDPGESGDLARELAVQDTGDLTEATEGDGAGLTGEDGDDGNPDINDDNGVDNADDGDDIEGPGADPDAPIAPEPLDVPMVKNEKVSDAELREELRNVLPDVALRSWPTSALILFKKTGAWPSKTKRGNLFEDIRRTSIVRDWTVSEVEDWIDGEIKTPDNLDDEQIFDEIYRRWKLPNNWTHEDAIANIRSNGVVVPAVTKDGVLINDRIRSIAPVSQWAYADLRAALSGDIEATASKEELVSQLRKRLGLSETFSAEILLEDIKDSPTEATMDNVLLKAKLDEYRTAMSKGQYLTEQSAADAQYMLYQTIRSVMQRPATDFAEGWLILINFISDEYNRHFNPDVARRGWSKVPLRGNALATFEDLLTLLIASRDPRQRRNIKAVCVPETVLRFIPNETERQNVLNFYHVQ